MRLHKKATKKVCWEFSERGACKFSKCRFSHTVPELGGPESEEAEAEAEAHGGAEVAEDAGADATGGGCDENSVVR